ncbi:MAG TPA: hypothetical protein VEN81_14030 [Planctomycetota bacterium]|jgi:uncharacterized protein YcgL (UPF0745 family)|nr:hypothetical protein [Planctomycetota bacterium]
MDGLKHLSGAKETSQDDFNKGTGVYIVTFGSPPKVTLADIRKNLGKYKLEGVKAKITVVASGATAGDLILANPKDEDLLKTLEELKGKKVVLSGALTEDDKGKQTLTLSKVTEAK